MEGRCRGRRFRTEHDVSGEHARALREQRGPATCELQESRADPARGFPRDESATDTHRNPSVLVRQPAECALSRREQPRGRSPIDLQLLVSFCYVGERGLVVPKVERKAGRGRFAIQRSFANHTFA